MSAGMPELGSKISLISKADIRYEGRLFTVDPKECTIALASVRSFGTEDRETPYPVPAQNQVYDYILFRGSDIKDIRVVNNVTQPLNDPAIMQLSVPPSMGQQPFQGHPMMGHMGPPPQMGQFGTAPGYGTAAMGAMAGLSGGLLTGGNVGMQQRDLRGNLAPPTVNNTTIPIGGIHNTGGVASNTTTSIIGPGVVNKTNELIRPGNEPSTVLSPAVETSRPNDHHASVLDIIGGVSRSTTPASLGSRKSPTNDQGVQAGGSTKQYDNKRTIRPIQPPGQQQQRNHQVRRNNSQERRSSRGDGQYQDYQRNYQNRQNMGRNQNIQGGGGGNQQRGTWTNRGPLRQRGRPRGGSGFKPNQGQPNQNNKNKNTLKFDNDYDFEQANTEFEELRVQLAKVKIEDTIAAAATTTTTTTDTNTNTNTTTTATTTATTTTTKNDVNGDNDKKDDSGNETGAGENEQEEDHEVFYDKTKSFFDKISCEAVERAKGKSQRTDWRTERKLNSETFGIAATRRGNFRGRGGFRGNMGYRGGFRGSYRPPPQQRRDQQPNNNRPQQQNDQQKQNSASVPAAADNLAK